MRLGRLLGAFVPVALAFAVFPSCSFRRAPANLEAKLDSIRKLEEVRRLRAQGIGVDDGNPLHAFYDSLNVQALPVRYTEDYVRYCDNYTYVPLPIVRYLNLEGRSETRAVSLPERGHVRLMMIAGFDEDGLTEMWIYSLDRDYFPKDKLCLFDIADDEENHYFAITSELEIYRDQVLYKVDADGIFQEELVGERPDDDEEEDYYDDEEEEE